MDQIPIERTNIQPNPQPESGNRKWVYIIIAVVAVLLVIVALIYFIRKPTQKELSAIPSVTNDTSGKKVGSCTPSTLMFSGKSSGFPDDIPTYRNAELLGYIDKQTFYCSNDPVTKIREFFFNANSAWQFKSTPIDMAEVSVFVATKGNRSVTLSIGKNGQNNTTTIVYTLN